MIERGGGVKEKTSRWQCKKEQWYKGNCKHWSSERTPCGFCSVLLFIVEIWYEGFRLKGVQAYLCLHQNEADIKLTHMWFVSHCDCLYLLSGLCVRFLSVPQHSRSCSLPTDLAMSEYRALEHVCLLLLKAIVAPSQGGVTSHCFLSDFHLLFLSLFAPHRGTNTGYCNILFWVSQ